MIEYTIVSSKKKYKASSWFSDKSDEIVFYEYREDGKTFPVSTSPDVRLIIFESESEMKRFEKLRSDIHFDTIANIIVPVGWTTLSAVDTLASFQNYAFSIRKASYQRVLDFFD